jgi:hypothetical protein
MAVAHIIASQEYGNVNALSYIFYYYKYCPVLRFTI